MNVTPYLPTWAKSPTQKFIDRTEIPGTETTPLDQDSFEQSFKQAAGALELAGYDEVPGEDQAMGRPGVVMRNGLTLHFEGDSSDSGGQVEVVMRGSRRGVSYATYVQARPDGFSTLQMVNDDGDVELRGSQVQRKGGNIEGYLLAGQVYASADPQ